MGFLSLSLEEIPTLIIFVKGLPRHLRVIWGIERLPVSITNATDTDYQIVAFFCDLVEVTLKPKIKVDPA